MVSTLALLAFLLLMVGGATALSLKEQMNRRQALIGAATTAAVTTSWITTAPAAMASSDDDGDKPLVAVIGANGRTGALCVTACLNRNIPVRALTRSGTWQTPDSFMLNEKLLSVAACDVKDPTALASNLKGCTAVIYAASASKKGGDAKAIDNLGVVAAAETCLSENIERYVILSSTATTRPASLGYKFTNVLGGIMDEKRKGEMSVQTLYAADNSRCSYTIVRPGGLEEPKKNEVLGPSALEISQGDVLAGIISRADLAEATVELALNRGANVRNTALEIYYTASAQPCERRFGPLLKNGQVPRLHGDSYEELLRGVQPNVDYLVI